MGRGGGILTERTVAHMNLYVGIGRITRDVEVKAMKNGGRMAVFGLAVGKGKKDKVSGTWDNSDTVFWDCTFFGTEKMDWLVSRLEEHGKKGAEVSVTAEPVTDSWDDKQTGQKRTKVKLIVRDVQILGGKGGGDSEGGERQPAMAGAGGYGAPDDDGGNGVPF